MGIRTGRGIIKTNINSQAMILDFLVSQVNDIANLYLIGVIYDGKTYFFRTYAELQTFLMNIKLNTVIYTPDLIKFIQFFRHNLYNNWDISKHKGNVTTISIKVHAKIDNKDFTKQIVVRNVEASLSINVDKEMGSYLDTENVKSSETPLKQEDYDLLGRRLKYMKEQIDKYGLDDPEINIISSADFTRKAVNEKWDSLSDTEKKQIKSRRAVTKDEWNAINNSFQGGLATPNIKYLGVNLKNVTSYDINSAYPCAMAKCMLPYKRITLKTMPQTIEELLGSPYGSIVTITFNNLAAKNPNIPTLNIKYNPAEDRVDTSLKAKNLKVWNDTHVISADELRLTTTFLDLDTIKRDYTYDSYKIHKVYFYEMRSIDKFMYDVAMEQYEIKANAPKHSNERDLAKKILNSLYGITTPTYISYEQYNSEINDIYNRFYRAWATFITAWVRHSIAAVASKLGDDFVYSDTDSVKLLNAAKHKNLFNIGNGLGQWKDEGTYELFKVFNTKSYMYIENGKLELVFSGLDGIMKDEMIKALEKSGEMRQRFKTQTYGLFAMRGHTYREPHIDDEIDTWVTDCTGKLVHIVQKGYELVKEVKFDIDEPQIRIKNINEKE